MAAPTANDLLDISRAALIFERNDLQVLEGDVSHMHAAMAAAGADVAVGVGFKLFADTFLDSARGDGLAALVLDRYGIVKVESVRAVGTVTFTHSAGPTGTIPAGTRVATAPDADGETLTFTTNSDVVFGGADVSKSVAATAVLGGKSGNVAATTVVRILDTLFDTFTVNNAAPFVGGSDEEDDESLRQRARDFWKTLRRGTLAAIEFGALQVPSVKRSTAVEDEPTGVITLYVTDGDGNSNAVMVAAVDTEIDNWRCAGSVVTVTGGSLFEQPVDVSIGVRSGVDPLALTDLIRAAINAQVARLKIGETLYREAIQKAVLNVDPNGITNVTVNVPSAASITPTASQIIRSPLSRITVT